MSDPRDARAVPLHPLGAHGVQMKAPGTGICECGCGRATKIATATLSDRGHVKGQPLRFLNGHNPGGYRHGHATNRHRTSEHRIWQAMLGRCRNPKNGVWKHYGGRGIAVCDRWLVFEQFLADVVKRTRF